MQSSRHSLPSRKAALADYWLTCGRPRRLPNNEARRQDGLSSTASLSLTALKVKTNPTPPWA